MRLRKRGSGARKGTVPGMVGCLALGGFGLLVVPVVGLLTRVSWSGLWDALLSPIARDALWVSAIVSALATILAALFGLPLGWVLARSEFPGKSLVRALVLLPLVMPPVVAGSALLMAFGRQGWLGQPLYRATGIVLPFSLLGVVLAVTFVSMPFLVVSVEGALRGLDRRYEGVAATLGARPWTVWRRVSLPLIQRSVWAGLALTWARALGEFGATLTFAGNLPGRTQTLPLAIYVALESDREAAMAMSLVMVLVCLVVLVALRGRWWGKR